MEELSITASLLRDHLKSKGLPVKVTEAAWTLSASPLGGRGVFATRDLHPGEVVFVDTPLVLGPRTGALCQPLCVGCHKSGVPLYSCSKGCGLPVCSNSCETAVTHLVECGHLLRWRNQQDNSDVTWSPELLRTVAAIRCLNLDPDQRRLVRHLQAHTGPQHEREVEVLKTLLGDGSGPSEEEEEFMRVCCRAMDANAFEVEVTHALPHHTQNGFCDLNHNIVITKQKPGELPLQNGAGEAPPSTSSLRGLYPLSGKMNHACTPNTRHGYDHRQRMVVRAATFIPRGTEVTTSYTALLWGTPARRHHLAATKHFLCACARCQDPQEGGSRLSALKCAKASCPGSLLPVTATQANTKWACDICDLRMPDKQARIIQATLGQMVGTMSSDDPQQTTRFLREQTLLPPSNQIIVEVKSGLVWTLGHRTGYQYSELSEDDLEMKVVFCRELLQLLSLLQAGQCRMRGLLLYELYEALTESRRRTYQKSKKEEAEEETARVLEEVAEIFADDVTSPLGRQQLLNGLISIH